MCVCVCVSACLSVCICQGVLIEGRERCDCQVDGNRMTITWAVIMDPVLLVMKGVCLSVYLSMFMCV